MSKKLIRRLKVFLRPFRNFYRAFAWLFFSSKKATSADILLIYDTASQPYSVGDLLILQVASNIFTCESKYKSVDIAFNYNKYNPSQCDKVFRGVVTSDNVISHLFKIIPILNFNINLNQFYIFSGFSNLSDYINQKSYKFIYPSPYVMASKSYITPIIFDEVIYPFFIENGYLPPLAPKIDLISWANEFLSSHFGKEAIIVTINIRNNLGWSPERNSNVDAWVKLFEKCENIDNLIFLVICDKGEIPINVKFNNVFFAKNYLTSLDQDMALIYAADFHMGSNSGPTNVAIFNNKPYRLFNIDFDKSNIYRNNIIEKINDDYHKFIFANDSQKIYGKSENFEIIHHDFFEMYREFKK